MQENRIKKWFENCNNRQQNSAPLLIITQDESLRDMLNGLNGTTPYFRILLLVNNAKFYNVANNMIIVTSRLTEKLIEKEAIIIDDDSSIKTIYLALQNKMFNDFSTIEYTSMEKKSFEDLVKEDTQSMQEFINTRVRLLQKFNCCPQVIDMSSVGDMLRIYHKKNILLASFAQSLYKLASLDFTASDKAIGGMIRKALGVKSKVFSPKSLDVLLPFELRKNHRVYDLNESQNNLVSKEQIAKKLIELDSKDLNINKIAKIVELPLKTLERMHRAYFSR